MRSDGFFDALYICFCVGLFSLKSRFVLKGTYHALFSAMHILIRCWMHIYNMAKVLDNEAKTSGFIFH